jgi:predicted CopG family antitoxin
MEDINIRIRKPAYERLRKRAFKEKKSIKQLVDELSQPKRGVPMRGTVN